MTYLEKIAAKITDLENRIAELKKSLAEAEDLLDFMKQMKAEASRREKEQSDTPTPTPSGKEDV